MPTPSKHIANILESKGYGELGENIFVSYDVPQNPDEMYLIRDTGTGKVDLLAFLPSSRYSYPVVQITVRGRKGSYQKTYDEIESINNFIQHWSGCVNGLRIVDINHLSGPESIGVDDAMRPLFVVNYVIMKGAYINK